MWNPFARKFALTPNFISELSLNTYTNTLQILVLIEPLFPEAFADQELVQGVSAYVLRTSFHISLLVVNNYCAIQTRESRFNFFEKIRENKESAIDVCGKVAQRMGCSTKVDFLDAMRFSHDTFYYEMDCFELHPAAEPMFKYLHDTKNWQPSLSVLGANLCFRFECLVGLFYSARQRDILNEYSKMSEGIIAGIVESTRNIDAMCRLAGGK